jgi:hypothetical protein
MIHRIERTDLNHPFRSTVNIGDQRLCSIVGPEHARVLIFHERAAIETTVLEK